MVDVDIAHSRGWIVDVPIDFTDTRRGHSIAMNLKDLWFRGIMGEALATDVASCDASKCLGGCKPIPGGWV